MILKLGLKWYNRLLALIIAILGGTTACEVVTGGGEEYGSPHAQFKINGQVNDAQNGSALAEVGVIASRKVVLSDTEHYTDTLGKVYTSQTGDYALVLNLFPQSDSVYLTFFDANTNDGKHYISNDTVVWFNAETLTGGDGGWYSGETTLTVSTTLEPGQ